MNLEKKYELGDVVGDDGIRTMKAREAASGRALEVHLFMKPEDHALFEQLQGLPLSARGKLLECGSELKIPYIVTDPVAGETNARAWFTTLLKPMQSTPEPEPRPIKASVWKTGTPLPDPLFPPADEPGEFTRMFQAPVAVKPAEPTPDVAASSDGEFTKMFRAPTPTPAATPVAEAPKPAEPEVGEFTRMFQAPAPRPVAAPVEPPPMVTRTMQAPVATPLATPADEATRLFQVPVAPEAVVPPPPPPPAKEPGEFTRLFQSMQQAPAAVEPSKPAGPGEFTRMFQSPLSPGVQNPNARPDAFPTAPPPPPPPHNRAGEFTQLFGTPSAVPSAKPAPPLGGGFGQSATGAFAAPQPPQQQQRIPQSQGPGQFTQMMSAGSAPTLGQQPPQQQSAPVKAKSSNMPLIVILGALALFAVLIVVFFAMRR